jgi:iron complex transport system ATP-binding protein
MTIHDLRAERVTLGYSGTTAVDEVDLAVPDGRITIVVGANASGKSTLLRGLARLLPPSSGRVLLDGEQVDRLRSLEVAKVLALLPQAPVAPAGITVADLVGRGRYPHQGWFRSWTAGDAGAVSAALAATGMADLAERQVGELSGGQRQRVWVAMALAQQTDLLLLDEPTTYLDVNHQLELLDLLTELNHARGTTIVIVLHELNLAFRYADHLVAMKDGRIAAEGAPRDIVTAEMVTAVFGMQCRVIPCPVSGAPMVVPVGRHDSGG